MIATEGQVRRWAEAKDAIIRCIGKPLTNVNFASVEKGMHERLTLHFLNEQIQIESRVTDKESFLVVNELKEVLKIEKPKINVKVLDVGDDPSIPIFHVEVESKGGFWSETFGSREQLIAFIKGLRCAFSFTEVGFIQDPEIPRTD